jgi:hypothetical protein
MCLNYTLAKGKVKMRHPQDGASLKLDRSALTRV